MTRTKTITDRTLSYVINRLRREASRHLRERTDYCRTRAEELRYQAQQLSKLRATARKP